MFFEEESKDTHGNMDDYDLDFEQDESVSWDKLLDDKDSDDETLKLLSEENDSEDSVADSLLNMDDESFENFIEEQKQNILKNKEKEEQKAKPKEPVVQEEIKIDVLEEIENIDAREQEAEAKVLKDIEEKMQEEIVKEPEPAPVPVAPQVEEDSQEIEVSFGEEPKEETVNVDEFVQDDYDYSEKPKAKKSSPLTIFALVMLLFLGVGYYVYTNVLDKDIALDFSNIASMVGIQTNNDDTMFDPTDINLPTDIKPQGAGLDAEIVGLNLPTDGKKATDKKEKEEKITLKVVESGRQTPFVPVANLNNLGFGTTPKLDIAKPFETLGQPDPALDRLMQIVVSGILHDGSANPSAVINVSGVDYFVQKGDKIDTFVVVEITRDTVVIKEKNNIFSATIGQRFTNTAKIAGEIKTVNAGNRQVQRQYTTLNDVEINIQ